MKILLTIAYDGTNYCGWQRQINAISIQEKFEDALSSLLNKKISLTGASRTDARVHALGQRVTFDIPEIKIPIEKLPEVINGILPKDIVTTSAQIVSETFHPRYDAKEKIYIYKINNNIYANPMERNYIWHIPYSLDYNEIYQAANFFIGEHDFKGFCSSNSSVKTTVRTIYGLNILQNDNYITIKIRGNGFLYNMVRIIVGTLVYVGTKKFKSQEISNIIKSCKRDSAGKTAPPQGLCLKEILYENIKLSTNDSLSPK